jgi:hypothetical protein
MVNQSKRHNLTIPDVIHLLLPIPPAASRFNLTGECGFAPCHPHAHDCVAALLLVEPK